MQVQCVVWTAADELGCLHCSGDLCYALEARSISYLMDLQDALRQSCMQFRKMVSSRSGGLCVPPHNAMDLNSASS